MQALNANVAEFLLSGPSKRDAERHIAELALGIVHAIKSNALTTEQACGDLFNLDGFQSLKRHRASKKLRELFEWGMELEDVAELAPDAIDTSLSRIEILARDIMASSV